MHSSAFTIIQNRPKVNARCLTAKEKEKKNKGRKNPDCPRPRQVCVCVCERAHVHDKLPVYALGALLKKELRVKAGSYVQKV